MFCLNSLFYSIKINQPSTESNKYKYVQRAGSVQWAAGLFYRLHDSLLVVVRALVEDEGDGSVPGAFQDAVHQAPLVKAVVPLGQVTGAVRVLWRRPDLAAADAAPAAEPKRRNGRKIGCSFW